MIEESVSPFREVLILRERLREESIQKLSQMVNLQNIQIRLMDSMRHLLDVAVILMTMLRIVH